MLSSIDTAFTERDLKANAYSAATIWGVFEIPASPMTSFRPATDAYPGAKLRNRGHDTRYGMLLLDTWHKRVGYPDLRKKILELAKRHLDHDKGDALLVEKKASGISLIQDLRRNKRLFVRGYDPKHDGDKIARAHLIAPHLKSGTVYIPDKAWAHKLVDIVAEFPAGGPPCADLTDTVTQAVRYITQRRWIEHPDDADADNDFEEIDDAPVKSAYG